MKYILILVLLMTAHCHAGWFSHDDDQRWQEYQQQLAAERQASGGWEIIAGLLAVGGVILFTVGTALGSKTKRDGKR